jgi:hypothetical protein
MRWTRQTWSDCCSARTSTRRFEPRAMTMKSETTIALQTPTRSALSACGPAEGCCAAPLTRVRSSRLHPKQRWTIATSFRSTARPADWPDIRPQAAWAMRVGLECRHFACRWPLVSAPLSLALASTFALLARTAWTVPRPTIEARGKVRRTRTKQAAPASRISRARAGGGRHCLQRQLAVHSKGAQSPPTLDGFAGEEKGGARSGRCDATRRALQIRNDTRGSRRSTGKAVQGVDRGRECNAASTMQLCKAGRPRAGG